jgi:CheY-like chemotaxis protein
VNEAPELPRIGAVPVFMTTNAPVVLLVEDDPLILIHSHLALEDAGFAALPVRDAAEALDLLSTRGDIRALFTDVRLPGTLDGLALAKRVRAERPDVAIVVTSGSTRIGEDMLPRGAKFLPKPYTAFQVTRLLAKCAA